MTIPHENALAFFPATVAVGNVTLRPLTLAGAVRLAEIGVDLGRAVPREKLFEAAYVLAARDLPAADPKAYRRFLKSVKCGLNALASAVETVLNDAFTTFVKPAQEKGATISLTPHGLGWPLEFAEFAASEYGYTFDEAILLPVATVFALYAAYRHRNGGKFSGFDYIERDYAKKLKAKKHH